MDGVCGLAEDEVVEVGAENEVNDMMIYKNPYEDRRGFPYGLHQIVHLLATRGASGIWISLTHYTE